MVAAVEVYENMQSFASLRQPAWHGLGTVIQEPTDALGMLKIAHMNDWNVEVQELTFGEGYYSATPRYITVRNSPHVEGRKDVLGIVKDRYVPIDNEVAYGLADRILGGLGRWETAGSIKNGSVVFGSLALDREIVLDPSGVADVVHTYLMVASSHDGSLALSATVTPVRVVCQNTLNVALKSATNTFKIRHTAMSGDKAEDAAMALGLVDKYLAGFGEDAKSLFEQKVNDQTFYDIIAAAYPVPEADVKGALAKWTTKVDRIESIYNGPTTEGIRGTGWGVANALTENLDWYRSPRNGNAEPTLTAAAGFDPIANGERNRLFGVVRDFATV